MTVAEMQWYVERFKIETYGMDLPDEDDEYVSVSISSTYKYTLLICFY